MSDRLTDDDLALFFLMHRAIRSDLAALPRAVARLSATDRGAVAGIGRWLAFVEGTISVHHRGEDEDIYPLVSSREPAFEAERAALEDDHRALDPALAAIRKGLDALAGSDDFAADRDALVAALEGLRDDMTAHLDAEEAALVPAMKRVVTRADLQEFERRHARATPMRDMALTIPWVLEVADAREREMIDAVLPWPVKLLYRLSWRRSYERLTRPVRLAGGVA